MEKTKNINMLEGPMLKNIFIYTIPIILTGVIQLLFNAADLAVVGRYCGEISVAAVGNATIVTYFLVNLFAGFSVGAGVQQHRQSVQRMKIHYIKQYIPPCRCL